MSKGIITFYINRNDFVSVEDQIAAVELQRKLNADLLEELKKLGYQTLFLTTTNESTRIEKIDFN